MSSPTADEALDILRELTANSEAAFHDGQLEAIEALVDHQRRCLVVQRTGWGKSAVYFIATALQRRRGAGPTVLISPLLALMRDQVGAAERAGITAAAINSATSEQWDEIFDRLRRDDIDILLVSPERLNNPLFRERYLPDLLDRTGLVVIDEAHCISDWGHDFRPDYRRIATLAARLNASVPVLATTATANERVTRDIAEQLGHDALTLRGSLARESLRLGCLSLPSTKARLGWLNAHLNDLPGSGIIYALTVSAAEDTARFLRECGHSVRAYTGRTDPAERAELEASLKRNEVKALVATSALGMGFDKPDLGFVIHIGAPSSPVAYYQQVGRAGRATASADVLLMPGSEDPEIWQYFATASMPDPQRVEKVLAALGTAPVSVQALEAQVDIRRNQLELLLKVLDVDGAVARVDKGWISTGVPWVFDEQRYHRIGVARLAEQQAMLAYERGDRCRMEFLQAQLDDASAKPCGRCDVCVGAWFALDVPAGAEEVAARALEQVGVEIPVRGLWPAGMPKRGIDVRGRIDATERYEPGRAIARFTDLGWGPRLRELLADSSPDQPLPQALVEPVVHALRDWPWHERPVGVVAMPSISRPQLVDSLAETISRLGKLPLLGRLELDTSIPRPPTGTNSAFRLAGVWGRFAVSAELRHRLEGLEGPVLLVDDVVDSRWSIQVAARELRRAGAKSVLPFALAVVA